MEISVVIPCFRCEATIRRAIASVAAQTRLPSEIIVVNDASGAELRQTLETIAKNHPSGWIRVIEMESNVGAASARNAGWDIAQGRLIAFLDADDAWHPRKLEIQGRYMEEHPEVDVCGHRHVLQRSGEAWPAIPKSWSVDYIPPWRLYVTNRFVTPSVIVRKELPFRFPSGQRHMEDHMLWMQIVASGKRVVRMEVALVALFKPQYGASGLSGQVLSMAKEDIANYWRLRSNGAVGLVAAVLLSVLAVSKFVRRMLLLAGRSMVALMTSSTNSRIQGVRR